MLNRRKSGGRDHGANMDTGRYARYPRAMCNLYSLTKGIRDWFRARYDPTGNLPLFLGIFPGPAPMVRGGPDGERELDMSRRGPGGQGMNYDEYTHNGRGLYESFAQTVASIIKGAVADSDQTSACSTSVSGQRAIRRSIGS